MLTKEIIFYPAYDKRNSDPSKNYGIGSVNIVFLIKGSKGAVQFAMYTDWYLPHIQKEGEHRILEKFYGLRPFGTDVGYHSIVPLHEGQEPMCGPGKCKHVPEGESCYYDGSSVRAQEWVRDILLPKGSEGVWEALEEEYIRLFGRNW